MRDTPQLRAAREERALSQRDLAAMSGVAHDTIGQLERGERKARPSTVRKLAEALGVEPSVLLADAEEVEPRVRSDFLPLVGHDELTVTEFFKRVDNDNLSEAELKERVREESRIAFQRAVQESYDTFRELLHLDASHSQTARPQGQQEGSNRSPAKEDKSLANRYKQYASPRVEDTSRTDHRLLFFQELEARRLLEAQWEAAGKWAEYYVSGEAAYIPKAVLVRETKPTEDEKNEIRSNTEEDYLRNALRLPSGTDAEEISILRLKLNSEDVGEIVEIAQKSITLARAIMENLRKKQASLENVPDHYFEDHTAQGRIETLRTALRQYREEALETVHELRALHAEATHRLEDAVDAMRKEGEELSLYVHREDI